MRHLKRDARAASRFPTCRSVWWRGWLLVLHTLAVVALMKLGSGRISAADDWEVMRVYIPENQTPALVSDEYSLVKLEELKQKLAIEDKRRRERGFSASGIEEAFYVCHLVEDRLISDCSSWKLVESAAPLTQIDGITVELGAPRYVPSTAKSLLENLSFSLSGDAYLRSTDSNPYWFSFSAAGSRSQRAVDFRMRLPSALFCQLLIALPANAQVSSSQAVVSRVNDPDSQLPDYWTVPLSQLEGASQANSWWLVNSTGLGEFDLSVVLAGQDLELRYDRLMSQTQHEYVVHEKWTELTSRFEIGRRLVDTPVQLAFTPGVKLRDVLVNGTEASWRTVQNERSRQSMAELSETIGLEPATLVVRSVQFHDQGPPQLLPSLTIPTAFSAVGTTTVSSAGKIVLLEVDASGYPVMSPEEHEDWEVRSPDLLQLPWKVDWFGEQPEILLESGFGLTRLEATSLNRVTIQSDWLSNTCNTRFSLKRPTAQKMRCFVGNGWFVDDVRVVNSSVPGLLANREVTEGGRSAIELNWDTMSESIEFELEVLAHRGHSRRSGDKIRLSMESLLIIPGSRQQDLCAIQYDDRFRVDVNESLLKAQVQSEDLQQWQQDLLTNSDVACFVESSGGRLAPITLRKQTGTYTADIVTVVQYDRSISGLSGEVVISCRPQAAALERLRVTANESVVWEELEWSMTPVTEGNSNQALIDGAAASGFVRYIDGSLVLPEAQNGPFILRAQIPLPANSRGKIQVPLIKLPNASQPRSLALLPRTLLSTGTSKLELLSRAAGLASDEYASIAKFLSVPLATDLVAARVDTRHTTSITLDSLSAAAGQPSWVNEERITHTLHEGGVHHHLVQWQIDAALACNFEFELPTGWTIQAMEINGVPTLSSDSAGPQSLQLSAGSQQAIELSCSSASSGLRSLQRVDFERPSLSIPVIARTHVAMVPPAFVPLRALGHPSEDARLLDRLRPARLWHWLAPHGRFNQLGRKPRWVEVTLTSSDQEPMQSLWVANRTAVAAAILAVVLLSGSLFTTLLARHSWSSWLAAGCMLSTVILAPVWLAPLVQPMLLGLLLALLMRCARPALLYSRDVAQTRGGATRLTRTSAAVFIVLALNPASTAVAQIGDLRPSADRASPREVFGVLIPHDGEGKISGTYGYVPTRLLDLLDSPERSGAGFDAPQILSADYRLRLRRGSMLSRSRASEVSATYRIRFDDTATDLQIPFDGATLRLIGADLDGQDQALGIRLFQDLATGAVVFQPMSPGEHTLQLRFADLSPEVRGGRNRITFGVPPIASATLRVSSESGLEFETASIGPVQESTTGALARIGPLDRIDVSWEIEPLDRSAGAPAESLSAETWCHASGNTVVAAARLRITSPSLDEDTLTLLVDAGWEPIGSVWGDVALTGSTPATTGSLNSYQVRLREPSYGDGAYEVRVLLAPKQTEAGSMQMRVPFLFAQGWTQPQRTFTWTSTEAATWRPDGIEFWPLLRDRDDAPWGDLLLSQNPRQRYIVPQGSFVQSLRNGLPDSLPLVDQNSLLRIGLRETKLEYTAKVTSGSWAGAVQLQDSASLSIESVLINGADVDYRAGKTEGLTTISIDHAARLEVGAELQIVLETPTEVGPQLIAPRVRALQAVSQSSGYAVQSSVYLQCEFDSGNRGTSALQMQPADVLELMESGVVRVDMSSENIDAPQMSYELKRRPDVPADYCVTQIVRQENGWSGRTALVWDRPEFGEVVCLRVSAKLRDQLKVGPLWRRYVPTGDPEMLLLCLLPPAVEAGPVAIELEFPIAETLNGQLLTIPALEPLTAASKNYLALPKSYGGSPIRWPRFDNAQAAQPLPAAGSLRLDEQVVVAVDEPVGSVEPSLPEAASSVPAELLHSSLNLSALHSNLLHGTAQYWIEPNGQTAVQIRLPNGCQVIGARGGGRPVQWRSVDDHITILLQPNYLPFNLSLNLQWDVPPLEEFDIAVAQLIGVAAPSSMQVGSDVAQLQLATKSSRAPQARIQQWVELTADMVSRLESLPKVEQQDWLYHWRPSEVGLRSGAMLTSLPSSLGVGGRAGREDVSVQEYWRLVCELMDVPPGDEPRQISELQQGAAEPVTVDSAEALTLRRTSKSTDWNPRLAASVLVFVAVLLLRYLAVRFRGSVAALMYSHVWIYWFSLAAAVWLLLPMAWPAYLLTAVATMLAVSQLFDSRRRQRTLARG